MARNARSVGRGLGFSLIELLVVIVIIALIIGIVLPALANVRDLSRKAATDSLLKELSGAVAQFRNDKRRLPGLFSARDMGAVGNVSRGMSGAENMMLELSTPEKEIYVGSNPAADQLEVGPFQASGNNRVWVNPDMVGTGPYFTTTGKNFVAQPADGHQVSDWANHAGASDSARQLKDLVDAWGQPLLVWTLDEASNFPVQNRADFARRDFQNNQYSRFYLNQNLCFLNATQLGRRAQDQTNDLSGSILSTVPAGNRPDDSLAGLLGDPASLRTQDVQAAVDQMLPNQARGGLVIQSAGSNGVYLGRKERGAKNANNVLYFGLNYKTITGGVLSGESGNPQATDVKQAFDDLISSAGN